MDEFKKPKYWVEFFTAGHCHTRQKYPTLIAAKRAAIQFGDYRGLNKTKIYRDKPQLIAATTGQKYRVIADERHAADSYVSTTDTRIG